MAISQNGQDKLERSMVEQLRTSRHLFMFMFVWNVLLAVEGRTEELIGIKTSNDTSANIDVAKKLGLDVATLEKGEFACAQCQTPESKLPSGVKLMRCGKCKDEAQRWVHYCGR